MAIGNAGSAAAHFVAAPLKCQAPSTEGSLARSTEGPTGAGVSARLGFGCSRLAAMYSLISIGLDGLPSGPFHPLTGAASTIVANQSNQPHTRSQQAIECTHYLTSRWCRGSQSTILALCTTKRTMMRHRVDRVVRPVR